MEPFLLNNSNTVFWSSKKIQEKILDVENNVLYEREKINSQLEIPHIFGCTKMKKHDI
jgi:hypothetical protein